MVVRREVTRLSPASRSFAALEVIASFRPFHSFFSATTLLSLVRLSLFHSFSHRLRFYHPFVYLFFIRLLTDYALIGRLSVNNTNRRKKQEN